ncbi:MAG: OsmC family protein [Nevskiaceae bacterium]|nr:MAG: OsmC family protein [Nevskiaceae bacterium]TBR73664.1 MAG: OsmC family protein [Nevskiaceae bacterium]
MEARLRWIENAAFMAETASGHALVVDGSQEIGGRNLGPRPMELLLLAAGSCASMDVVSILRKTRQKLASCEVKLAGTRAETGTPKPYTAIHLQFIVAGNGLTEASVSRAVQLSVEKYCSAIASLAPDVKITHGYEIAGDETTLG